MQPKTYIAKFKGLYYVVRPMPDKKEPVEFEALSYFGANFSWCYLETSSPYSCNGFDSVKGAEEFYNRYIDTIKSPELELVKEL